MKKAEKYFEMVIKGFEATKGSKGIKVLETENATMIMEDIFKIYWMARVRFCSFIASFDEVDADIVNQFKAMSMTVARRNRSKIGELITVISVIICKRVSDDIRAMAESRPPKHTTSSEYLVIVDLSAKEAYYYKGPILYGLLYEKFEREYIHGHFALPLTVLSSKK